MKKNKLAVGAIIGAATGVVAGMLTAPKSGRETRDDIKRKTSDVLDQAVTKKDELLFKAEEIGDEMRDKAAGIVENLTSPGDKK